jgi:hypothetical protein
MSSQKFILETYFMLLKKIPETEVEDKKGFEKIGDRLCNSIGTIDYSYRGEIIACVDNVSYPPEDYKVTKGQRLVQITGWNNNPVRNYKQFFIIFYFYQPIS